MIRHLPGILSTLGPLWLANRLRFAAEAKLGFLERRTPAKPWQSWPVSAFVALRGIGTSEGSEATAIDALVAGAAPFLKDIYASGLPPRWHVNPLGGASAPADQLYSDFGLTASIWTKDIDVAEDIGNKLETGTVFMNRCDYVDPALPWTGVKDTGRGASLSVLCFESLTRPKGFHLRHKI